MERLASHGLHVSYPLLRPGEAALEPEGALPRAPWYLVHPLLSDVIGRINLAYLN